MSLLEIRFPLQDPVPIFAIVLFIILLAPILLRKLRIPSIIGLILAGMAIGDHGFNIIAKGSIDLFGKAGLLYIMFLAGLELEFGRCLVPAICRRLDEVLAAPQLGRRQLYQGACLKRHGGDGSVLHGQVIVT